MFYMTKTVTKIGNSKGIILDAALLELAHWKEGDQLSLTIHDGGSITFTPLRASIKPEDAATLADSIISSNDELFRRLSH
jgi:antitoxin component of MazEF toxin-antitoxin module